MISKALAQASTVFFLFANLHINCECMGAGAYEPPKAARSVQLRRTAFAFTRI